MNQKRNKHTVFSYFHYDQEKRDKTKVKMVNKIRRIESRLSGNRKRCYRNQFSAAFIDLKQLKKTDL